MPIERSLRGQSLEASSPGYIRVLRRGAMIAIAGTATFVLYIAGLVLVAVAMEARFLGLTAESARLLTQLLGVGWASIGLVGWWMLTMPDPVVHAAGEATGQARQQRRDMRTRRVLRVLLVISITSSLLGLLVVLVPALAKTGWSALSGQIQITPATVWSPEMIVALSMWVLMVLCEFARFFMQWLYMRSLAQRIPSQALATRATRCMWIVPLGWTVGWLVVGLGPIYATWYQARTLGLFVREFRLVLERQSKGVEQPGVEPPGIQSQDAGVS